MKQNEPSASVFEAISFICPEFSDNCVGQSSSVSMYKASYSSPNVMFNVLQHSPLEIVEIFINVKVNK